MKKPMLCSGLAVFFIFSYFFSVSVWSSPSLFGWVIKAFWFSFAWSPWGAQNAEMGVKVFSKTKWRYLRSANEKNSTSTTTKKNLWFACSLRFPVLFRVSFGTEYFSRILVVYFLFNEKKREWTCTPFPFARKNNNEQNWSFSLKLQGRTQEISNRLKCQKLLLRLRASLLQWAYRVSTPTL